MLKALRHKKTRKRILIILAAVIVPAFTFWGFSGALRSQQQSRWAGKISGKRIPLSDYQDALSAERNLAIIQYGENFTEIEKLLNLDAAAWERLILLSEARKRKISVTDKEVIDYVEQYPFFQRNGRFDNSLYSQMLQYVFRTQPRQFEEQTRQNLFLSKLYQELTRNLKPPDDKELNEEYIKLNEEVSLYYIYANPLDFAKELSIDDTEIKDYFLKNSIRFKQPLSFNIEYVSLSPDDKGKENINEAVKKLFLRLKKGEDFAKAAQDFNLTLKQTGLFGESDPIPGIGWSPQIKELIARADIGEYLNPLQIDKTYYILKVTEKKEPYIPDFETIKDKVREGVIEERSRNLAEEKMKSCLKELRELYRTNPRSLNFESIAKNRGLKTGSTDMFKYGSYIEGIGASDNFWTTARNLKKGEHSGIITAPSGFYIIRLKSRTPIDEKKFAAEKDGFAQLLLLQKKQEYFTKFTEELKRKAQRF
ncbi:MAG: peptidylprolyl isomerase [Candidatus Omnitrophota bacterium]|jgi:peptidyl-prolyl cis-trans isomerase D